MKIRKSSAFFCLVCGLVLASTQVNAQLPMQGQDPRDGGVRLVPSRDKARNPDVQDQNLRHVGLVPPEWRTAPGNGRARGIVRTIDNKIHVGIFNDSVQDKVESTIAFRPAQFKNGQELQISIQLADEKGKVDENEKPKAQSIVLSRSGATLPLSVEVPEGSKLVLMLNLSLGGKPLSPTYLVATKTGFDFFVPKEPPKK